MRHSPHQLISGRDCARTKVPHASLRGQGGSKEDGTHLLDGVLQPCAQVVTHPPWIGMFLLSVFRIPSVLAYLQSVARRHHTRLQIAPQSDQQLAGHRDDGDAPDATLEGPDTLLEPDTQRAVRLMTNPQPGPPQHS